MAHLIELHKVSKFYRNKDMISTGLSKVDLTLDRGEFVVITGESGSGKSTLLNVISGLDSYEEGEMFVCGEDTSAFQLEDYERYRKTQIGNIFQDYNLINSYTVYQNVELAMLLTGCSRAGCQERVNALIDQVGLGDYRRTKASKLSGGQKQRVAIARALAKDAPIIVADEPTGNLDSAAAESVMRTLHEMAGDKLVIVVTHNYEQAAPYATRQLTLYDGRLIEDKRLAAAPLSEDAPAAAGTEAAEEGRVPERGQRPLRRGGRAERHAAEMVLSEDAAARQADSTEIPAQPGRRTARDAAAMDMGRSTELRLGVRNTFNLPAKFLLLFMVYLFVSLAVLSQYASTKNELHTSDLAGYNQFFTDTSPERIVVTRSDGSPFEEADYSVIAGIDQVDYIVKADPLLDSTYSLEFEESYLYGTVASASLIDEDDLSYGALPTQDNGVVLRVDALNADYEYFEENGEALIGKAYYLDDDNTGERIAVGQLRITGIVLVEDDEALSTSSSDSIAFYVGDTLASGLMGSKMASVSRTTISYNGTKVENGAGTTVVYSSAQVPAGRAYIFEPQEEYFKNNAWKGKPLTITVENDFFTATRELTVDSSLTAKTCQSKLGIAAAEYEENSSYVYINPADYQQLYQRGNYQSSVFVQDELSVSETAADIRDLGYETLVVQDTLTDISGGMGLFLKLLSVGKLIIEFVVLFFIAYAVIRLIMRSRNSYYSTLRILGANRKSTDRILRIELLLVMLMAYGMNLVLIGLTARGVIQVGFLQDQVDYLQTTDYLWLLLGLLLISLLIARRYSRKIFQRSAMHVYREEVER